MGFFYGVFKGFIVWLLLKMFYSKALASFADHNSLSHFPMSSPWTEETAMASLQQGYHVGLAIAPIIRLISH